MRAWKWIPVLLMSIAPVTALAQTSSGFYLKPADALPGTQLAIASQPKDAPIALDATEMAMDQDHGIIIARGKVEVMQGDSILTADQITYYQKKDMVIAEGNVSMLQPSGDVYFAEKAELKDAMKRAVIEGFKARFADGSVLVAGRATKSGAAVTNLKKASYTPCNLCTTAPPFWQMNAADATIDDVGESVTYRNAFMEMFGYPMFYIPYLSHPTPDAQARSGLLTPSYSTNYYLGLVTKLPYYWRISPDKEIIVTPWVTTEEGPLLQWDYSQLRDKGDYRVEGSVTYPHKIDAQGNRLTGSELRGHIFASGSESIDENASVGFNIQATSDDTYLRRYSFGEQQALFSNAYYEYAQGRNLGLINALSIQGLRSADDRKKTPWAVPVFQGYYETKPYDSGLTLHVAGDAQMLTREQGVDQRRISVTPGATLPIITEGGQVFTATVNLRQDIYNTNDLTLSDGSIYEGTVTRTLPQAALEWRYPLINSMQDSSWLLEPVVFGVAQPNGGNSEKISNEDSRLIELSDTNLFSIDRMPGLDLNDSGSRIAYGMRSQYYSPFGVTFDGLLGQNYNFNSDTPFPNSTHEDAQFSDYIGRIAANYVPFNLTYRFAVDSQDASLNRSEVGVGFSKPWLSISGSYLALKNNRYLTDSQEGTANATLPIDDNWSLYGSARRDIDLNQMVSATGGIIYKNECFTIMLDGLRVYTRDRDIEPVTEFTFRVGFKNLGEFGGK